MNAIGRKYENKNDGGGKRQEKDRELRLVK